MTDFLRPTSTFWLAFFHSYCFVSTATFTKPIASVSVGRCLFADLRRRFGLPFPDPRRIYHQQPFLILLLTLTFSKPTATFFGWTVAFCWHLLGRRESPFSRPTSTLLSTNFSDSTATFTKLTAWRRLFEDLQGRLLGRQRRFYGSKVTFTNMAFCWPTVTIYTKPHQDSIEVVKKELEKIVVGSHIKAWPSFWCFRNFNFRALNLVSSSDHLFPCASQKDKKKLYHVV